MIRLILIGLLTLGIYSPAFALNAGVKVTPVAYFNFKQAPDSEIEANWEIVNPGAAMAGMSHPTVNDNAGVTLYTWDWYGPWTGCPSLLGYVSYVRHQRLGPDELSDLITSVHRAIGQHGQPPEPDEVLTPAVSVRRSVHRDYVVCLDSGYREDTYTAYNRATRLELG